LLFSPRADAIAIDRSQIPIFFLSIRAFLTRGDVAEMEDIADEIAASLAAENATPLEVRQTLPWGNEF
jgi:hypothetical protein